MAAPPNKPVERVRVLLIEDTPRLRDVLLAGIKLAGFDGYAAPSAEVALQLMEQNPFDVLLLDLNLPGIGGMELFARVREHWPDTEVIILTGFGDLEAARQAIHLDVVEFLTKPASLGEIEQALTKAWRRLTAKLTSSNSWVEETQTKAEDPSHPGSLEKMERNHILEVLDRHQGNRETAAAELGVSVRTLYYRLAAYRDQSPPLES